MSPASKRAIPFAVFVGLFVLFYFGFTLDDATKLPSALVDRPFPAFALPSLQGNRTVTEKALEGSVQLVNVWATWCPTCADEHDELERITRETGIAIVGINYKDDPSLARSWLVERGDPYALNVVDRAGDLGVELGVYGAPETFLVDAAGTIRHKLVGAMTRSIWEREFEPRIGALARPGTARGAVQ